MITVDDFQKELAMDNIKLIAGKEGLNNIIEYLDVQEFPFKSNRVHKHSVILTTFFGYKNNDQIIEHFNWYSKVGVSAVFFHNVVYSEVPSNLVLFADSVNIPLFCIPDNIPYHILYERYNNLLYEERTKYKNEIDQLNQNMLDALVIEKDIQFILKTIGKYLNELIIYLNKDMDIISLWSPGSVPRSFLKQRIDEEKQQLHQLIIEVRVTLKPIQVSNSQILFGDFQVFPLNSKNNFYGYLIIGQEKKDVLLHNIIIKNTVTALVLDAMKKNQTKEYHKNTDIKLLEEIFTDKRLREITTEDFYCDISGINYLLIADPQDKSKIREYYESTEARISSDFNGLVWVMDNKILALIQKNPIEDRSIFLQEKDIRYGISGKVNKITKADLKTIYDQANVALHYSYIQNKNLCCWDELGWEKIMYFMKRTNLLKDYHIEYLKPLIDNDQKHDTNFLKTLYVYLQTFFSLKETGEILHLHPNTVKYRINKIESILDRKIDDKNQYIDLIIALKYYFYNLKSK